MRTPPGRTVIPPLAILALGTVLDLVEPSWLQFGPILAAAPVLAAALTSLPVTAGICVATIGIDVLLGLMAHQGGLVSFEVTLAALIVVSLSSLLACSIRRRREGELTRARSVAETAQRSLLRPLPARVGRLRLGAVYLAADAEARAGGDMYEVLHTPFGVRLLIGDVRGKGLAAVEASAALLGAFREAAYHEADLAGVADRLEESVNRHVQHAYSEEFTERFATVLLVEIPDEPVARLVHCGHPEPLALRGDCAEVCPTPSPGPPIGLASLVGGGYTVNTIRYGNGDRLVLCTDGVIEARDSSGRLYPLRERAARWADAPLPRLVNGLSADLLAHVDGTLEDDAALLALERLP